MELAAACPGLKTQCEHMLDQLSQVETFLLRVFPSIVDTSAARLDSPFPACGFHCSYLALDTRPATIGQPCRICTKCYIIPQFQLGMQDLFRRAYEVERSGVVDLTAADETSPLRPGGRTRAADSAADATNGGTRSAAVDGRSQSSTPQAQGASVAPADVMPTELDTIATPPPAAATAAVGRGGPGLTTAAPGRDVRHLMAGVRTSTHARRGGTRVAIVVVDDEPEAAAASTEVVTGGNMAGRTTAGGRGGHLHTSQTQDRDGSGPGDVCMDTAGVGGAGPDGDHRRAAHTAEGVATAGCDPVRPVGGKGAGKRAARRRRKAATGGRGKRGGTQRKSRAKRQYGDGQAPESDGDESMGAPSSTSHASGSDSDAAVGSVRPPTPLDAVRGPKWRSDRSKPGMKVVPLRSWQPPAAVHAGTSAATIDVTAGGRPVVWGQVGAMCGLSALSSVMQCRRKVLSMAEANVFFNRASYAEPVVAAGADLVQMASLLRSPLLLGPSYPIGVCKLGSYTGAAAISTWAKLIAECKPFGTLGMLHHEHELLGGGDGHVPTAEAEPSQAVAGIDRLCLLKGEHWTAFRQTADSGWWWRMDSICNTRTPLLLLSAAALDGLASDATACIAWHAVGDEATRMDALCSDLEQALACHDAGQEAAVVCINLAMDGSDSDLELSVDRDADGGDTPMRGSSVTSTSDSDGGSAPAIVTTDLDAGRIGGVGVPTAGADGDTGGSDGDAGMHIMHADAGAHAAGAAELGTDGRCIVCRRNDRHSCILICDGAGCEGEYHYDCLSPALAAVPEGDWLCPVCRHAEGACANVGGITDIDDATCTGASQLLGEGVTAASTALGDEGTPALGTSPSTRYKTASSVPSHALMGSVPYVPSPGAQLNEVPGDSPTLSERDAENLLQRNADSVVAVICRDWLKVDYFVKQLHDHLLRARHQQAVMRARRKQAAQSPDTAYLICDFKMKFLPMSQVEFADIFYGKRGMSWHGCVVQMPAGCGDSFVVHDIMHSDQKQDTFTVVAIIQQVCKEIKRRCPNVTKLVIQSDNASCYTSKAFVPGAALACSLEGLQLEEVLHNEAQDGKTELDGLFGICSAAVKRWCAAHGDVKTPEDLVRALIEEGPTHCVIRQLRMHNSTVFVMVVIAK